MYSCKNFNKYIVVEPSQLRPRTVPSPHKSPSSPPQPPLSPASATDKHDLSPVPIVLLSPECPINEVAQYLDFQACVVSEEAGAREPQLSNERDPKKEIKK